MNQKRIGAGLLLMAIIPLELLAQALSGNLVLKGSASFGNVPTAVPSAYSALYTQLTGQIATFQASVNTACSGCATFPVKYFGEVTYANSNAGWAVLPPGSLTTIKAQIDGLHTLGFTGIAVQAGFPLLLPNSSATPWYSVTSVSLGGSAGQYQCPGDSTGGSVYTGGGSAAQKLAAYTSTYAAIAAYARNTYGMKVVATEEVQDVASQVSGPHSYADCLGHWYPTLSLGQLGAARALQSVAVATAMLPDYLAISEEPSTEAAATGLALGTVANSVAMVNTVLAAVRTANPNPGMKLSAGLSNFQGNLASFISSYTNNSCGGSCVSPAMDYLDIHFFLVNTSSFGCPTCNYQTLAFNLINNAAAMPVAISQAWTHKELDAEWGDPSTDGQVVEAREVYSFWDSGVDTPWWALLHSFANLGQCTYAVPFDTLELYGYVTWSTGTAMAEAGGTLTANQVLALEQPASEAAKAAGLLSSTGTAIRVSLTGH